MLQIPRQIAQELNLNLSQVENVLQLLQEGATIPFIARYRKERTGSLDEVQLREIADRSVYLSELEGRKKSILESIESQGKLTDELKAQIENCQQKTELEDLYLPYKPKRRTRATIAKEKGLEPLAQLLQDLNRSQGSVSSWEELAKAYLNPEKGVETVEEALKGAGDIIAEQIAETAALRSQVREQMMKTGAFVSQIKKDYPEGTTKYEMYRNYSAPVSKIAAHNLLALFRGEEEKVLRLDLDCDRDKILENLEAQILRTRNRVLRPWFQGVIEDSFSRLMKPSLTSDIRNECKLAADIESIQTFETNLRELLLSPPAGMKPTLAIDPGFCTGCKVAVLDETAKFLEYQAIFPHQGERQRQEAARVLVKLIGKYGIELIAIGNGTASRETDQFVTEVLQNLERKPIKVMVNESGASIYSASDLAREEFPDLDVTVRGAISIGRRLQDPLAELVKIDPKSIGVGQYQHDVNQKLLKKQLDETVESCVNYVGVDLNTASMQLLSFVSGITPTIAKNVVKFRDEHGAFKNRRQLLKVPKLGPKAFEQAAGFLRIREGENPLDNTAVHPESYGIVEQMVKDLNLPLARVGEIADRVGKVNLQKYRTEAIGLPTLKDIVNELQKPGRDPRAKFEYATFREGINEITDLKEGMILEGVVSNVVNFGAFVDIGVHQDGLIHISEMADYFVSDPKDIVKVGQVVKVRVLEVNEKLKRIGLSLRV
ncbi:Tex family protein [Roseofilum sp. BLCC_M91]|uniref:Tex family protein n=1 Tax=Roseofilum halophilum BLCC-M91 TaxID=3022259 RepID=A0ABT7BF84_9CYAN|nr:Tex family protein [Roseofilum halophilum]MDJ1177827.1 Tex family protein [Roseofilum halophilum BLCC-M91]